MGNEAKVSVIVPVYNSGRYLEQCVNSVLHQSYVNWELILINDGSKDDSGEICDRYASSDKRIKVIHKPNSGVSSTRNIGIDLANGDYLIFLDADDYWVNSKALEDFVSYSLNFNLDIVRANYFEFGDDGRVLYSQITHSQIKLQGQVLTYLQYMEDIVKQNSLCCVFMIKKSALGTLRFDPIRRYMEDEEIHMRLFKNNLKCMYLNMDFYAYRKHPEAVTVRYNPAKYQDAFKLSAQCYDLAIDVSESQISCYLLNHGLRNYLKYIKELSTDKHLRSNLSEFLLTYDLIAIRRKAIKVSRLYGTMRLRLLSRIPLCTLVTYYKLEYIMKSILREFYRLLKS